MIFQRGLGQAIAKFDDLDKKIIQQIADKLAERNFPLDDITEIQKGSSKNEFLFIVSPTVEVKGNYRQAVSAISYGWERKQDEYYYYDQDGSLNFTPGTDSIKNYQFVIYGYQPSYVKPAKNSSDIIAKVDGLFKAADAQLLPAEFHLGLKEIAKSYYIRIIAGDGEGLYKVSLLHRGETSDSFALMQNYIYNINLNSGQLELEDSYLPNFYPTPAEPPIIRIRLVDIARRGLAVMGAVVAVDEAKNILRLKLKKIWLPPDNTQFYPDLATAIGEEREFALDTDDAAFALPHSLNLSDVRVGQDAVLVGGWLSRTGASYRLLPADAKVLTKMDLFFVDNTQSHYFQTAPAETLYADLKDPDLTTMAFAAMCSRHLLAPQAFLAFTPDEIYDFGSRLGERLAAAEFDQWLAAINLATREVTVRLKLADLARNNAGKIRRQTHISIMRLLDVRDKDQRRELEYYVADEAAKLEQLQPGSGADSEHLEELVDFSLAALSATDESVLGSVYHRLGKLLDSLPSAKRIPVVKRIGRMVSTTKHAQKSEAHLDDNLYEFFIEQVKRGPSPDYIAELGRIDLSLIPATQQFRVEARAAILSAGLAIAQANPSSRPAVVSALNKWASDEAIFNPGFVLSIDSESPQQKKMRWAEVLKQFKALGEN